MIQKVRESEYGQVYWGYGMIIMLGSFYKNTAQYSYASYIEKEKAYFQWK